VPRDLELICRKCLEKEPERRYLRASDLAADLEAWLEGRPIRARSAGTAERAWRWARRHPLPAALLCFLLLSLLAGTGFSTYFGLTAVRRAGQAQTALANEEEARRASEKSARAAREAQLASDQQAAELQLAAGQSLAEAGQVDQGMFLMLRAWDKAPEQAHDLRRLIRLNLETWLLYLPRLRWANNDALGNTWGFLPEGQLVRFVGNQLFLHDPATGRQVGQSQAFPGSRLMACSPDGQRVVTRTERPDGYVLKVFDRLTAKQIGIDLVDLVDRELAEQDPNAPYRLALCSNPFLLRRETSTGQAYDWQVWDLRTGKTIGPGCRAPFSSEQKLLTDKDGLPYWLSIHAGGKVEVREGQTGKSVGGLDGWGIPEAALRPPDLFPQRNTLQGMFAQGGPTLGLWDSRSGRALAAPWSVPRLSRLPHSFQVTADGRSLAGLGVDHRLRWYDLATQRPCLPGASLKNPNGSLWLSLDGKQCLFLSDHANLWQLFEFPRRLAGRQAGEGPPHNLISDEGRRASFGQAAFSPDRETVLLGKTLEGWKPKHARLTATGDNRPLGVPLTDCDSLGTFSPSGQLVAVAAAQDPDVPQLVCVHDAWTGKPRLSPIPVQRFIHTLLFSPDESKLAIGHVAGVHLVDLVKKQVTVLPQPGPITRLLFSPDSTQLLLGVREGWGNQPGLRFWDVRTARPVADLFPMADAPILIPDRQGPGFTTLERDSGRLRRWSFTHPDRPEAAGLPAPLDLGMLSGFWLDRMPGYRWGISPDGRRLAMGSSQGRVIQWDLETRQRLGQEATLGRPIELLEYTPDGNCLAVSGEEGTVVLLDARTTTAIGPGLPLRSPPVGLAFTPDGRELLAACRDGRCVRFDLGRPVPLEQDQWQLVLEAMTGVRPEGNALEVLTPAEHQQRLDRTEALRRQTDAALAPAPTGAAWHALEVQDALQAGQLNSAHYHLDRWVALEPDAWLPLAWRGMVHTLEGLPREAEADFEQAAKRKGGEAVALWKQHLAVSFAPLKPPAAPPEPK